MSDIKISDNDYVELLIKHIARQPEVRKLAEQYKLTGDDVMLDEVFGNTVYKLFIDSIMNIPKVPTSPDNLSRHINNGYANGYISSLQNQEIDQLFNYIYTDDEKDVESTQYIQDTLRDFLKKKRGTKLINEHKDAPDLLATNLSQLAISFGASDLEHSVVSVHPFAAPIFKTARSLIGTGISCVDDYISGLGHGEFALIIGYSGGGKTVTGVNIVANNAILGRKAVFVSCEEDEIQISQRFYSKVFDIAYTDLHRGLANIQLAEVFKSSENTKDRLSLTNNLYLLGLKGLTPVNGKQIYELLLKKFDKDGFVPEVVVVDQLQFIEPVNYRKGIQSWELEKLAAAEMDELSHMDINGHKFALWVLHQAKGKLKRHFSREDIDGFKGIIHKADLALGIGRDGINASECDIFSLKVRHCPDFSVVVRSDFKYMRFAGRLETALGDYKPATSNPMPSTSLPPLPDLLPCQS
ncbi:putative SF4 helicase domain-containing protein [Gammaproteobacteria bacterium]